MLRPTTVRSAAGALILLALSACGNGRAVTTTAASPSVGITVQEACDGAAGQWGGTVSGAFAADVGDVRAYVANPHGADSDPGAPRPGTYDYPPGWDELDDRAAAAVCYLDGPVPKAPPAPVHGAPQPPFDRRLVITAAGLDSFMVLAGYRDDVAAEPLPRR